MVPVEDFDYDHHVLSNTHLWVFISINFAHNPFRQSTLGHLMHVLNFP